MGFRALPLAYVSQGPNPPGQTLRPDQWVLGTTQDTGVLSPQSCPPPSSSHVKTLRFQKVTLLTNKSW